MSYQDVIDQLYEQVIDGLTGLIAIWSGAIVDIPDGWHLCDGTDGTVDLRDKFVMAAGSSYDPHDTGGAASHTHGFSIAPHTHTIAGGNDIQDGTGRSETTSSVGLGGTTNPDSSLPPYYSLAYIQKV